MLMVRCIERKMLRASPDASNSGLWYDYGLIRLLR